MFLYFFLLYNYYGESMKLRLWVKIILVFFCFLILITLYSRYIGTSGFIVKEYPIVNSKIPNNFYGLKIIQISDIHYKMTTNKKELENIINEINLLKPDIVVLNGDLFDKNITYTKKDYKNLTKLLNKIDYNIAKYAIKGDNDLNNKNWEKVINDSNFINLNNTYELIYYNSLEPILITGIGSNSDIKKTIKNTNDEIKEKYNYSILVLHEPDYIEKINYSNYNLILAGHSLNGQIKLPFIGGIVRPKGAKKYYDEYYKLNNTDLYITGGIGTSKFKFRLNNKSSFNLFRLRNK